MIMVGGALQKAALTMAFPGRRMATVSTSQRVTANGEFHTTLIYNGPGVFSPETIAINHYVETGGVGGNAFGVTYELRDMSTNRLIMQGPVQSAGTPMVFTNAWPNFEGGRIMEPNKGLIMRLVSLAVPTPVVVIVDILGTEYL